MNNTLLYFSSKYGNKALWYLALFAKTPHPFNMDLKYIDPDNENKIETVSRSNIPDNIPSDNILRRSGTEEDAIKAINNNNGNLKDLGYTPRQAQAIQRKHVLRRQALKLTEPSAVLPEVSKGSLLKSAYVTMRDPRMREANNDIAALDRYRRSLNNQLSEAEKSMPVLSVEDADAAKKRLSALSKEDWDSLDTTYRSVSDIKQASIPVTENITDATSPIGRGAKKDAVRELKSRQQKLAKTIEATGIDPRTGEQANLDTLINNPAKKPSYIANPESIDYVTSNSPEALANKNAKMEVKYNPDVGQTKPNTGLQRRIDKIKRMRDYIEEDTNKNTTVKPTTPTVNSLPTVTSNLTPDAFNKGLRQEIIQNPTPDKIEQAKYLLNKTPVEPRPDNSDSTTNKTQANTSVSPPPVENEANSKLKTKKKNKIKTKTTVINEYPKPDNLVSRLFKKKRNLKRLGLGLLGAGAIAGGSSLILNKRKKDREKAYLENENVY